MPIALRTFRVRQFGNAPYGNYAGIKYGFKTAAAGYVQDAGVTSGTTAIGEVLDLGELQQDMLLIDSQIRVITALTASVTGSLGFKYSDGIDHPDVPQDDAYFGTGIVLNAVALLRVMAAKRLVKLPKPARLILTFAGAANAKASEVEIIIFGEMGSPQ